MAATALHGEQSNTIQTIAHLAKSRIAEAAADLGKFNTATGRAA